MKGKFAISALLCLTISVSSCSDWLEAVSSTQFQEKDMFNSREGFQDALTGVYLGMGESISGVTFATLDLLVYPYLPFNPPYSYLQAHEYNSVNANYYDAIWSYYYNVIANVNIILSHMEEAKEYLSCDKEWKLYYGELLGLRAYTHFDLMRVFGLAHPSEGNLSKLTVPFQLSFAKDAPKQLTYEKALELLNEDLDAAIGYLSEDPVRGIEDEEFQEVANFEGYWNYRSLHFNYYAALALKARIAQWYGDYDTAKDYATRVISEAFDKGAVSWVNCENLLAPGAISEKDWSFSTEHLFALEIQGLYDIAQTLFGINAITSEHVFKVPEAIVKSQLYPDADNYGQLSGSEDVRGTAFQLRYFGSSYVCYKLYSEGTSPQAYRNKMPRIKVSEMYYILAECAIREGDNELALSYLNTVRKARNIQADLPSTADALDVLNKEYYREFLNEGQLFFWLKHIGVDKNFASDYIVFTEDNLILPYPTDELTYGRVQDK